jgi:hypothetical protein
LQGAHEAQAVGRELDAKPVRGERVLQRLANFYIVIHDRNRRHVLRVASVVAVERLHTIPPGSVHQYLDALFDVVEKRVPAARQADALLVRLQRLLEAEVALLEASHHCAQPFDDLIESE